MKLYCSLGLDKKDWFLRHIFEKQMRQAGFYFYFFKVLGFNALLPIRLTVITINCSLFSLDVLAYSFKYLQYLLHMSDISQ